MQTTVQKWGNSLGIRIPSAFSKELNLKSGSQVEISDDDGRLVIIPKRISLEDLVSRVTDENKQVIIEDNSPIGNEEW